MKIIVSCSRCISENNRNTAAVLEFGNESTYNILCDNGHSQKISLPQQRHEILFEVSCYAVVDGYYREAISSFAASIERYYEFFVNVICVGKSFTGEHDKSWKLVASQSERQLGAYIFSYLLTYDACPEILPPKLVELRNKVIHKGYIPKKDEAINFGASVAKLICDGCERLKSSHKGQIDEIIRRTLFDERGSSMDRIHIPKTYLSVIGSHPSRTLAEHLSDLISHNQSRF